MTDGAMVAEATARAKDIIQLHRVVENPLVQALEASQIDREGFLRSQEQFYFAVDYYPRPMAALLSRLSDPTQRLGILRNLVDEHGEFTPSAFHRTTFRVFLERLGGEPAMSPWNVRQGPAVRAFNAVVAAACGIESPAVGLGLMGVIELAFADISARLGKAVVARGWMAATELIHYSLHAELDLQHACDFFTASLPWWESQDRQGVEIGFELGAFAFRRLYESLFTIATPAG